METIQRVGKQQQQQQHKQQQQSQKYVVRFPRELEQQVEEFVSSVKRRTDPSSNKIATKTLSLLGLAVTVCRWQNVSQLIDVVKQVGQKLIDADRREIIIGNMVRRVLHNIRELAEEHGVGLGLSRVGSVTSSAAPSQAPSRAASPRLGGVAAPNAGSSKKPHKHHTPSIQQQQSSVTIDLRPVVIDDIKEVIDEIQGIHESIANSALDQVHSSEIIMTLGHSKTVSQFLLTSAKKRNIQVVIAETAPTYTGRLLAKELAAGGISTTLIPDSAVFTMMSRVNKVILGTHAVLADGSLIAEAGSHIMANAAKYFSIPVIVLSGIYKISPQFPFNKDAFNVFASPDAVLPFTRGDIVESADVVNPVYDYVAPTLVNLFITDQGSYPPTYLYRLLLENYHQLDMNFGITED
ncbi:nagb/rpia/CoA transferase-like protein [Ramicandelaber brevisporus]|nr:nagb/rpia/CoA transferase-like protein [Ramicandelaber brevisporus]